MPKYLSDEEIAAFRERLIDAAERLFAEHGTEAVTIRQLAAEIGVSPMTRPYRYFTDKDAILAASAGARLRHRHAEALERAYEMSTLPPGDRGLDVGRSLMSASPWTTRGPTS